MGILGKIISPEKLVEGVGKAADKFFDGQGDKAQRFTELLKLYEPFKIAQRVLAFMFSGVYLLSHLIALITLYFDKELSGEIWHNTNENLLYPVLAIVSFYFTGGVINGMAKRFSKNTSKRSEVK
jgi:hypothetical protein